MYPMRGESWHTGPELVVALDMGAKIEVLSAWRIDWMTGSPIRPLRDTRAGLATCERKRRPEATMCARQF